MLLNAWETIRTVPILDPNTLHIWRFPDAKSSIASAGFAICSPAERERAAKLYHASARLQSLHNRAHRRRILGGYLGVAPEKIQFQQGPRGKPYIVWPQPALQFSLSHSGSLCLMAVHQHLEIGLDLEQIQPRSSIQDIGRRMFDPKISAKLAASPPEAQMAMFYYHWTRLEATIKVRGGSLFAAEIQNTLPAPTSIVNFIPVAGFQACIATYNPLPPIEQWRNLTLAT